LNIPDTEGWAAWQKIKLKDDRVFISGKAGKKKNEKSSNFIYDPKTGETHKLASFMLPRFSYSLVLLPSGKILVMGGSVPNERTVKFVKQAEIYDPYSGKSELTGNLIQPRSWPQAIALKNEQVLVLGNGSPFTDSQSSAELYDVKTGRFTQLGEMLYGECNSPTLLLNGNVLCMTGDPDSTENSATIYDASKKIFRPTDDLNEVRSPPATVLLANRNVLIVGGFTRNGYTPHTQTSMEVYDYKTERFSRLWGISCDFGGTFTLLKSGKVLFAGGNYGSSAPSAMLYQDY
jgi:hypothetical protein